jgi:hypothetical protein
MRLFETDHSKSDNPHVSNVLSEVNTSCVNDRVTRRNVEKCNSEEIGHPRLATVRISDGQIETMERKMPGDVCLGVGRE